MPPRATTVTLSPEERRVLEAWAGSRTEPYRRVQRARAILLAAEGKTGTATAQEVDLTRRMVSQWRQRFAEGGRDGLVDQPRSGRPRIYTNDARLRVMETACAATPPGETHWSVRNLAQATGVGRNTVHRILRENRLNPHRVSTFSQSPDPDFVAKVIDIVGLYMDTMGQDETGVDTRGDLMPPGRPPPTIVRRTAWEFAGLIVANSGDSRASSRNHGIAPRTGEPWPRFREYPLWDYS
jgi:transposase